MKPRPKIPRNAIVLAFVALASGFGQDLIAPILPGYLLLLGVSRTQIGLVDGLLQGTTNICRFVSGWLSDRSHRRKEFVFFGYALSSVARPLLAAFSSFLAIAGLRIVDGAGKGTKDAPRDALIAEAAQTGASGRAFGFQRMIDTAGSVIGPLTAFALLAMLIPSLASYRFIFALAVVPGAIALGLIWFGVREPSDAATQRRTKDQGGHIGPPLPRSFWIFTAVMMFASLTKINDSLFLVRAHDLGLSQTHIPLLFGAFTFLYAVLSYPIGIWSDRIGKMPLLAAGWILLAFVEFGFSFDPSLPMTFLLFAGYGLFFALTEGSARAFIADVVSRKSHGNAYGIFYTSLGIGLILGGYLLGRLWDHGTPELAFRVSAMGSLIGGLAMLILYQKTKRPDQTAG